MAGETLSPANLRETLIIHASEITEAAAKDAQAPGVSGEDLLKIRKQLKDARRMLKVASRIEIPTEISTQIFPDPIDTTSVVEPSVLSIPETPQTGERKKRVQTFGKREKDISMALVARNEDGTLKYSYHGDKNLILDVYKESFEGLDEAVLKTKIQQTRGSTFISSKRVAERFEKILKGENDPHAQTFFEEMRNSDPANENLSMEDAIRLLTRKSPGRKSRGFHNRPTAKEPKQIVDTATPQHASIEREISQQVRNLLFPFPGPSPKTTEVLLKTPIQDEPAKLAVTSSTTQEKPVTKDEPIQKADIVRIPAPKLPLEHEQNATEKLLYALVGVHVSGQNFLFPDARAAILHVNRFYFVGKASAQNKRHKRDSLIGVAEREARSIAKAVEDSEGKHEEEMVPYAKTFLRWKSRQPLYKHFTPLELAKVIRREMDFNDVVQLYKERRKTNSDEDPEPVRHVTILPDAFQAAPAGQSRDTLRIRRPKTAEVTPQAKPAVETQTKTRFSINATERHLLAQKLRGLDPRQQRRWNLEINGEDMASLVKILTRIESTLPNVKTAEKTAKGDLYRKITDMMQDVREHQSLPITNLDDPDVLYLVNKIRRLNPINTHEFLQYLLR